MTETAAIPKLHRSTLDKCGCPSGFEKWLIKENRAEIIEDVPKEKRV